MNRIEKNPLGQVCEILGLLKKGTKDQVVDRILEFCMSPTDSVLRPGATASKTKSPRKSSSKSSPKKKSSPKSKAKGKAKAKPGVASKGKKRKLDSDEEEGSDVDGDKSEHEDESPRKRAREGPLRTATTGKTYQVSLNIQKKSQIASNFNFSLLLQ